MEDNSTRNETGSGNGWISGMRAIAWIIFAIIILFGILFAIGEGFSESFILGFLIFLGSVLVAFLFVAGLMVFLNMAQDVSEIKQILRNGERQQCESQVEVTRC